MSFSICLKCKKAVGWYDKYCSACQIDFGLPDLPDWQKENFTHENFDAWAKREVEKDLKKRKCPHKRTTILNEEGYAGIYCVDCGEQLKKEC